MFISTRTHRIERSVFPGELPQNFEIIKNRYHFPGDYTLKNNVFCIITSSDAFGGIIDSIVYTCGLSNNGSLGEIIVC